MAGFINVIRSTLAELANRSEPVAPVLPVGLPAAVRPVAEDGVALLINYQSAVYAQLYSDRLRRFVGRRNVRKIGCLMGVACRVRKRKWRTAAPPPRVDDRDARRRRAAAVYPRENYLRG